ncbi:MAG: hypothetical protein ACYC5O_22800 [Anaerolineae bacterium]
MDAALYEEVNHLATERLGATGAPKATAVDPQVTAAAKTLARVLVAQALALPLRHPAQSSIRAAVVAMDELVDVCQELSKEATQ